MKHTLQQLSAMSDRELDAVVAEVVMGWKWHLCHELNNEGEMVYHFRKDAPPEWWKRPTEVARPELPEVKGVRFFVKMGVPYYSSDWSAMGEVVGEMKVKGFRLMLEDFGNRYRANFIGPVTDGKFTWEWRRSVEHADAPRAASIAAVLAVEASHE